LPKPRHETADALGKLMADEPHMVSRSAAA
jgi:hypothetical protein